MHTVHGEYCDLKGHSELKICGSKICRLYLDIPCLREKPAVRNMLACSLGRCQSLGRAIQELFRACLLKLSHCFFSTLRMATCKSYFTVQPKRHLLPALEIPSSSALMRMQLHHCTVNTRLRATDKTCHSPVNRVESSFCPKKTWFLQCGYNFLFNSNFFLSPTHVSSLYIASYTY